MQDMSGCAIDSATLPLLMLAVQLMQMFPLQTAQQVKFYFLLTVVDLHTLG